MNDGARAPGGLHTGRRNAAAAASVKANKWRETTGDATTPNFARASQTQANKDMSLWPGKATNSMSEVRTEQLPFIAFSGVMVPLSLSPAPQ